MTLAPERQATFLREADPDAAPATPRSDIAQVTPTQRLVDLGSLAGGLGLAWVICHRLLPLHGVPWLVVVTFLMTLLLTVVTGLMTGSGTEIADRLARVVITSGAGLVGLALVTTLGFIFQRGWRPLMHLNFFFDDMSRTGPRDPFSHGGIGHAILGSAIEIGIAVLITVPLGVGTAVFMTEVGGKLARVVRTVVEAMTALPSIVAGLFVYTVGIIGLGLPRSGLCGALAISVMILPIIARASDVVLRVVPGGLREASLALGASRWKTVWHVVLPTARPGLATALILGIARGVGETSPVLITSGVATFYVSNPTAGVMNSLPLYIYTTVRSGEPMAIARAFGAASVLLFLVLCLFVTARVLARPRGSKPTLRKRVLTRLTSSRES